MSRLRGSKLAGAFLAVPLATALITGCSSGDKDAKVSADLPPAQEVLSQSATAMKDVSSVAFNLTTEGSPEIPVKAMQGDLLKSGDAQGTATISALGQTIEAKFVLVGPDFYYYVIGKYTKAPRSTISNIVDPSAILNPDKGVPLLLTQAQNAQSTAHEDGSVKIDATLPAAAVSGLGVKATTDVKGSVWVSDTDHRLTKVRMEMPGGSVILALSNYNADPQIKAPQ
ncbi:LppX_LprAFG lipoprotein [Actinocorallia lasiicapitis]